MEKIDGIKILHVDGTQWRLPAANRNVTDEVIDFALRYRVQAPMIDNLMKEIGIEGAKTTRNQEVFWISDLQKSTQGQVVRWDSLSKLHLVPIQFSKQSNVFVDTAYLENPFAAGGGKNVLHVKVRNDGDKAADRLNLKLTINETQAATTSINIPAKGTAETSFDLSTTLSGLNETKLAFNDFPITFDNEFYMALNFTDKIRNR